MSVKTINLSIDDLINKVKEYDDNEEDLDLIRRAFDYALDKHFYQKRISGEDYIQHPLNVAYILTDVNADAKAISAALLHDTIVTFDMGRENYKSKYKNKCTDEELEDLVNISVRRTLYRTILTTITTIVPVICLMVFGSHEIMNFNIALLVGFIVGVYSSIFISNNIWLYLEKRRIHKPIKEDKDLDDINELKIKGINC